MEREPFTPQLKTAEKLGQDEWIAGNLQLQDQKPNTTVLVSLHRASGVANGGAYTVSVSVYPVANPTYREEVRVDSLVIDNDGNVIVQMAFDPSCVQRDESGKMTGHDDTPQLSGEQAKTLLQKVEDAMETWSELNRDRGQK